MTDKPNWCQCEPTRCEGVGRCRWQAMDYRPGEARRQADRAEGFAADCLKIRVALGLGLHSHDDLVEAASALRKEVRYLRQYGNKDCTAMADDAMQRDELDS